MSAADPIPLARLRELLRAAPGPHGGMLIDAAFLRDIVAELLALRERDTTPPTREEIAAHEAHGGFWLVSQVENARRAEASDLRPMVLRVLTRDDRFVATVPGIDYGSFWDEPDPFSMMPGATWTPLARDGAPMARGPR